MVYVYIQFLFFFLKKKISTNGVMQGETLSPISFSLYINDCEGELVSNICEPTPLRDLALFLLMCLISHNVRVKGESSEYVR